jgi:hypothetical protein
MTRNALIVGLATVLVALAGCDGGRAEKDTTPQAPGSTVPTASTPAAQTKAGKKGAPAPVVASTQPPAPPLPADVDLGTTDEELGAQALITAQEEVTAGNAGGVTIADRHRFIFEAWRPQMQDKQGLLRAIVAERKAEQKRQVSEAVRMAQHDKKLAKTDAELSEQVEAEKRKTVPILPNDDEDE